MKPIRTLSSVSAADDVDQHDRERNQGDAGCITSF
jgi:hypothetical protein